MHSHLVLVRFVNFFWGMTKHLSFIYVYKKKYFNARMKQYRKWNGVFFYEHLQQAAEKKLIDECFEYFQ